MNRNPVLIANQNETITTMALKIQNPPEESKMIQMGTPVWSNAGVGKDLFVLPTSESLRNGVYLNGVLASDVRFNEGDTMLTAVAVVTGGVVSVRVEKGLETSAWNPYLIINDTRLGECRLVLNHAVREKAVGEGGVDEGEEESAPVYLSDLESDSDIEPVVELESKGEPESEGVPDPDQEAAAKENLANEFEDQISLILCPKLGPVSETDKFSALKWRNLITKTTTFAKNKYQDAKFHDVPVEQKNEIVSKCAVKTDSIFKRIPGAVLPLLVPFDKHKFPLAHLLAQLGNYVKGVVTQVAEIPDDIIDAVTKIDHEEGFQYANLLPSGAKPDYEELLRTYYLKTYRRDAWDNFKQNRVPLEYPNRKETAPIQASFAEKPQKKRKQRKKESSKLKVAL